jgi:hypothetical protein
VTHLLTKLSQGGVFWMFTIAGLGMLTLCIGFVAVVFLGVPEGAGELLGVIVALIGSQINSVINAIRAKWRVPEEGDA